MKMRYLFIFLLFFLLIILAVFKLLPLSFFESERNIEVLLIYDRKTYQVDAFKSVLEEEGVPYRMINLNTLLSLNPKNIAKIKPAVILPDGSLQYIHPDAIGWFKDFANAGGSIFISYDVGIKDNTGAYLKRGVFSEILGLNYVLYDKLRDASYSTGQILIKDKNFQITPGKIDEKDSLIVGYIYGPLIYPYSKTENLSFNGSVITEIIDNKEKISYFGIVCKSYRKGYLLYSSLPLGHLKAYSDDLILRATLRYFLFKLVKIPHLINTPKGKGGLVINWHIDANPDWKSIPVMIEKKYVRKDINYSFDITAGPFRDEPGDKLGFDACGKGRKYVEMIMPYGVIGSHGGWAHNWFSEGVEEKRLSSQDIFEYIKKNNECLESITGYKIREYAAPAGIHPQPTLTEILEKMGFIAYYYTGDSGSSPNRTFIDGRMVSSRVLAFPITPFGKAASFYEIYKERREEKEVYEWLKSLIDFIVKTRQIRLIYSHTYDIPHFPEAILKFIDYAEEKQKKGELNINTMIYFADFLLRFLQTDYRFEPDGEKGLKVSLKNSSGLKDITIAVPKSPGNLILPDVKGVVIDEDESYYYLYFVENPNTAEINLRFN